MWLVLASPLAANLVGSVFNVLYNRVQVAPLLSEAQMDRFEDVVLWFNLVIYPIAAACFIVPVVRLWTIHQELIRGESVDSDRLSTAQRRIINLPWWFLFVSSVGWLSCVPVFPLALVALPESPPSAAIIHLVTSFLIASLIAVTHGFFAVELTIQRTLFPVFFQNDSPSMVAGGVPLGMGLRGILWTFSAVVCPVISLLLLLLVPDASHQTPFFAVVVSVVAISFAFATSWMLAEQSLSPIRALQQASHQVAEGDLDTAVSIQRADELGRLIDSFNAMLEGLRERERLEATFGRHVGKTAAEQILKAGDHGQGTEQPVTVMFVDVRNFTRHSSTHPPAEVVAALNVFFSAAVERVEFHDGLVNKFLGDGLMALFGIGEGCPEHADQAVAAAIDLQRFVDDHIALFGDHGWTDFAIGIGIHTGPAIVGSIGSPQRQEYTAMGDTVNLAARIESLTKVLGVPILVSAQTRSALEDSSRCKRLPPQVVKGKDDAQEVFAVET